MATKRLNLRKVERLGRLQCSPREAAGFLGLRQNVFERILSQRPSVQEAWERGKQLGKVRLRVIQWRHAETDSTMARFLGENYLDQRRRENIEHTGKDGGDISYDVGQLSSEERDQLRKFIEQTKRDRSHED